MKYLKAFLRKILLDEKYKITLLVLLIVSLLSNAFLLTKEESKMSSIYKMAQKAGFVPNVAKTVYSGHFLVVFYEDVKDLIVPKPALLDVKEGIPYFYLPSLAEDGENLASRELAEGDISLMTLFNLDCDDCKKHLKTLSKIGEEQIVYIYGATNDNSEEVYTFLAKNGDPFEKLVADTNKQLIKKKADLPMTWLVDGEGRIRCKYMKALTMEVWKKELLPRINKYE